MSFCRKCGAELEQGNSFCPRCGNPCKENGFPGAGDSSSWFQSKNKLEFKLTPANIVICCLVLAQFLMLYADYFWGHPMGDYLVRENRIYSLLLYIMFIFAVITAVLSLVNRYDLARFTVIVCAISHFLDYILIIEDLSWKGIFWTAQFEFPALISLGIPVLMMFFVEKERKAKGR